MRRRAEGEKGEDVLTKDIVLSRKKEKKKRKNLSLEIEFLKKKVMILAFNNEFILKQTLRA